MKIVVSRGTMSDPASARTIIEGTASIGYGCELGMNMQGFLKVTVQWRRLASGAETSLR